MCFRIGASLGKQPNTNLLSAVACTMRPNITSVLLAAAMIMLPAPAHSVNPANTTAPSFAQVTALLGLLTEQLAHAVPVSSFAAVLNKAMDANVAPAEKVDAVLQLALDITNKVIDGPRDFMTQGLNRSFVLRLPAAIPTVSNVPSFNITDFPMLPWLNRTIIIRGFPKFEALNRSLKVAVPVIPILASKIILANNVSQANIQFKT